MINHKIQMTDTNRPLNHRVELWREESKGKDRYGEEVFEPVMVDKLWSLVIPDRGKEYRDNYQVFQTQSYKVTIRYREDIDPSYWLVYKGKRLDIEATPDLQSRTMYIELLCTERVDTNGSDSLNSGDHGIY